MKFSCLKKKILLTLLRCYKNNKYDPYVNLYEIADEIVEESDYYVSRYGHLKLKRSVYVSMQRSLNRLLRDKLICVESVERGGLKHYSLTSRGIATARNLRSEIVSYINRWNNFI